MSDHTSGPPQPRPAEQLGRELRRLRLAQATDAAPMTQQAMAARVFVGGKAVVSLLENGHRIPSAATLSEYAKLPGAHAEHLIALRQKSLDAREQARAMPSVQVAPLHTEPSIAPLVTSVDHRPEVILRSIAAGAGRNRRRGADRILLVVGVVVVVAVATAVAVLAARTTGGVEGRMADTVRITTPRATISLPASVRGVVHGYTGAVLWLDVQKEGEKRHHPTESPVARQGDRFDFNAVYAGREQDVGDVFQLTVLDTPRGSAAYAAFNRYANRPDGPRKYLGLRLLPPGAVAVDSVYLTRR